MSIFFLLVIIIAVFYMISIIKKHIAYKKLNPIDIVTLTEDNKSMRNICGVFMFFIIITSGITIYGAFRKGLDLKGQFLDLFLTLFFFAVLYAPLSSKTRISNVGIYRNANLIHWKDIVVIDYLKPDLKGRLKVKITYKNNYNKQMVIELCFKKKKDEYNAFKKLSDEYKLKAKEVKQKKNFKDKGKRKEVK